MKFVTAAVIMAVTFYSCTSTVMLSSFSEANRKVGKGSAELHMKSGQIYDGKQIEFGQESTWFINRGSDSLMQVRTHEIEYLFDRHRTGGALEGLLIGGAIGATGGLIGSMSQGTKAGIGQVLAAVVAGAFGSLAGLAVGTVKGHEYRFVLPQDSSGVHND